MIRKITNYTQMLSEPGIWQIKIAVPNKNTRHPIHLRHCTLFAFTQMNEID